MNRNILITGASGFVGAWLAKYYIEEGYDVVSIMHDIHPLSSDKYLGIYDKITWCLGDITDTQFVKRVVSDHEVDEVIHCAAITIVRKSFRSSYPIFDTNVMGTISILDAVKEIHDSGFPIKMLYLSTDKYYGDLGEVDYREESYINPDSIYGCTKACADLSVQTFSNIFNLSLSVIRSCNIYGFGDDNSRVIPNTIFSCLKSKSPIIYDNLSSIREYIYIKDICEVIKLVLDHTDGQRSVYNTGTGETKTQREVVEEILKYFPKVEPHLEHAEFYKLRETPFQRLSSSKIFNELGWKPKVSFEEGIKETVQMWKDYKNGSV